MEMIRATSRAEALSARASDLGLLPINGGTDVMVGINFGRLRPTGLLDLRPATDLAEWSTEDGHVLLGSGVTYTTILTELGTLLPGLAMAVRTVGSPQIRNAGTVGGNVGTASPAGDALPPLIAARADVLIESAQNSRSVPVREYFTGVKRSVLAPNELVTAVRVPTGRRAQQFAKIGTRNAMVIAVASFALDLDPVSRQVGTGIGSAAPTTRPALEAEDFLTAELADRWEARKPLPETVSTRFAELVATAASPIDDVRGSADYRRHALRVLARRTLGWAWADLRRA